MSLQGKESPVIDGFTGEERFFLGLAQSSRIKWREQFVEYLINADPHSPDVFRINGVVTNVDDFYTTYDVIEGGGFQGSCRLKVKITPPYLS